MFNNIFFFENCIVYEIMWKYMVEPNWPHNVTYMRIACWMSKATDTHSEYLTLTDFPRR